MQQFLGAMPLGWPPLAFTVTLDLHASPLTTSPFHLSTSSCFKPLRNNRLISYNVPFVAVRTHDYDYPESEMDERESLYFDTISLADSEAAAAAAAHRKSLSQSRNTIYHSAVDLAGDEGRSSSSLRLGSGAAAEHAALAWQPGYRQSTALEHLNGGGDYTDAALSAQILALQNGRGHLPTGIGVGVAAAGGGLEGGGGGGGDDEVSRRLLRNSSTVSNKDKKLPITYSQWKSRVNIRSN